MVNSDITVEITLSKWGFVDDNCVQRFKERIIECEAVDASSHLVVTDEYILLTGEHDGEVRKGYISDNTIECAIDIIMDTNEDILADKIKGVLGVDTMTTIGQDSYSKYFIKVDKYN